MTARNGKPCKKCGESDWYDSGKCKSCQRASVRARRESDTEAARAYEAKWRMANPEKARESSAKWYSKNRERVTAKNAEWQEENREKVRAKSAKWQAANRDKSNAKTHRRRTRKTNAGGSFTASEWRKLCKRYDGRCLRCGEKTKLTADHVIPVSKGGSSNISNIQPLCLSCNSSKGNKTIDFR